mmetsp:Transcript_1792/g.5618  ORF Transcript_1792/g.5618 Transcript_1792/m.5618 type:complete len:110 (-) Transcript_1792:240-569(-)
MQSFHSTEKDGVPLWVSVSLNDFTRRLHTKSRFWGLDGWCAWVLSRCDGISSSPWARVPLRHPLRCASKAVPLSQLMLEPEIAQSLEPGCICSGRVVMLPSIALEMASP